MASSSASKTVLHTYFRSSASYRLRMALNYKGIAYEQKFVNLVKGEQKSDEYKKLNPSGLVPTLEIDGLLFRQSMAVMEYLDERKNGSAPASSLLLPRDPIDRQRVRELAGIIACDTQPIANLRVLQSVDELGGDKGAWAKKWMLSGLTAFDQTRKVGLLKKGSAGQHNAQYSYGAAFSIADICLLAQIYNAERWKLDLSTLNHVPGIAENLKSLEFCKNAHPHMQGDCPEDLRGQL